MNEQDKKKARPDVESLLQALREQADRQDCQVRFEEAGVVRCISDDAAAHTDPARARLDTPALLRVLRQQADCLDCEVRFRNVGIVQRVGDGVARLSGLHQACTDDLLTFPTGVEGLILSLDHDRIDVILLGPDEGIRGGDLVTSTGERLRVPVGRQLLGRVVDPLGRPLDGRGPVDTGEFRHLEREAPGILERMPTVTPLHTGLKIVDALMPIGRGQRELIVGDRQTGKTTLAVDAILNQRESGVLCVYVAIGQKKSSTLAVIETLRGGGALAYTTVVASSPDDPPALRYLAPYAGCTMAEFLMHEGHDVLIVYDDLTKHAGAYRELSLLLRRPPGREAYPGDVHYLHARLMERACKLGEGEGSSLTAMPIVETQRGNIVACIPTNLICTTDMRIVLDADLFNRGVKPAVNVGLSVSRLIGAAQTAAMRDVAGRLRVELAQFEEVARFSSFGIEVDAVTQRQIRRGERLRAVLTQPAHQPLPLSLQIASLLAATEGDLDNVPLDDVSAFESGLLAYLQAKHPEILSQLDRSGELDPEMRNVLIDTIADYHTAWLDKGGSE